MSWCVTVTGPDNLFLCVETYNKGVLRHFYYDDK